MHLELKGLSLEKFTSMMRRAAMFRSSEVKLARLVDLTS